jgi:hypothetical protein
MSQFEDRRSVSNTVETSANTVVDVQFEMDLGPTPETNTNKESKKMSFNIKSIASKVVSSTKHAATFTGHKIVDGAAFTGKTTKAIGIKAKHGLGHAIPATISITKAAPGKTIKGTGFVVGEVVKGAKAVGQSFKEGYKSAQQTGTTSTKVEDQSANKTNEAETK